MDTQCAFRPVRLSAALATALVAWTLSASAADVLEQWQGLSLGAPQTARSGAKSISQVNGVRGTVWRPIGPSAIQQGAGSGNGRISSIAVNPFNPFEIYIGAAGGGVWRTRDFGESWAPLLDEQAALGIGEGSAIALDPFDSDTIYVGTSARGVLNLSRGILKSTDAGGSWVVLGNDCPIGNSGNADDLFSGHSINVIRVDPEDPAVLYVASDIGLFRSTNGGLNWAIGANSSGDARSLVVDESSSLGGRILYAGVSQRGVLQSTDGGVTWSVSLASSADRISVALARQNSQVLYAATAEPVTIFSSVDAGGTWAQQPGVFAPGRSDTDGGNYLSLAVDPASPGDGVNDILLYGAVEQFRSTDSGASFANINNGILTGTRADWAFFQPDDGSPTHIYTGNDGGLWRTLDNGAHWTGTGLPDAPATINDGALQVSLLNNLDFKNDGTGSVILGAVVNHGITRTTTAISWSNSFPGAASDVVFDGINLSTAYASSSGATSSPCVRIVKSTDDGMTWPTDITPWLSSGTDGGCYSAPLAVNPNHANMLYAGGSENLWQTKDGGATWRIVGSNGPVTSIAVSRVNSNRVAQAVGSRIYVSTNVLAASSVSFRDITRNLPARPITRLAFDPNDANFLYVTLSGSGGGHVFRATLTAAGWTDISPPIDLPVHALALDGKPTPTAIYVGTPLGVARSVDSGQSWTVLDDFHLPNVPVTELAFHAKSGRLLAGTFGRGVFELKEPDGPVIAINVLDPEGLFTDTTLDFGSICLGKKKQLTLQIFNAGNAPMDVFSVYRLMGSSAFRVVPNPATPLIIGPNEEVDFTIEFTALALGEDKAILRVSSDDPTAPWVDFIVTGNGVAPGIASVVPDNGSFGSVPTSCGFSDLPLTINNPGACDLLISNIISDNGQFLAPRALTYPLLIHPGDSMNVWLRFEPTNAGPKTANYSIINNAPGASPHVVPVSGNGLDEQRIVTVMDGFAAVPVTCGFDEEPLTIQNSGACPLIITGLASTSPHFTLATVASFPVVIAPGNSLTINVRFVPLTVGTLTGNIVITSDDRATPIRSIPVSGIGLPPQQIATVIADNGFFGERAPCDFHDLPLTINNPGNCTLTILDMAWARNILCCSNPIAGTNLLVTTNISLTATSAVTNIATYFSDAACAGNAIVTTNIVAVTNELTMDVTFTTNVFTAFNNELCSVDLFECPSVMTFPLRIAPGGSLQIPVRFHPKSCCANQCLPLGMNFGAVAILSDDPINPLKVVPFSGVVKDWQKIATIIADDGDFGPVAVGAYRDLPIAINNSGACDLVITNILCTTNLLAPMLVPFEMPTPQECSNDFVLPGVMQYPLVIHPGDSLQLPIRFAPMVNTNGAVTNLLEIFSNDPKAPVKFVTVSGTEAEPGIVALIPDNGDFGNVPTCEFRDLPVTLNNRGSADLVIFDIATQPPFIAPRGLFFPLVIAPGASLEFSVRFMPDTPGDFGEDLEILSNDRIPLLRIPFSGSGLRGAALATAFPDNGNYGSVPICEFRDLPLTINNTGKCDLVVTRIYSPVAAFAPPSVVNYPLVVHPGDSMQVSIRFAPPTATNYLAPVYVESNGGTNQVGVFGNGLPRQRLATVIPDSGYFGGVAPCDFRDLPLTINNPGNCPLTISSLYVLQNFLCCTNSSGIATIMNLTNVTSMTNVVYETNVVGSITNISVNLVVTMTTNLTPIVKDANCNGDSGCLVSLFELPSVVDFPLVVHPGDSMQIPIRFAPKTCCPNGILPLGTNFGVVAIASDDPNSPLEFVTFHGVVQDGPGLATVIASGGDFGAVQLGDFKDMPLTLNNTGRCDLLVSGLGITHIEDLDESFFLPDVMSFPLVIHPGDSLEVPIRFRPLFEGAHPAVVTIYSNDPRSPHYVNITGTGATNAQLVTIENPAIRPGTNGNPFLSFTLINNSRLTLFDINLGSSGPLVFVNPLVVFPSGVAPGARVTVNVAIVPITLTPAGAPFNFRISLGGGLTLGPLYFTVPGCIDIQNVVAAPLDSGGRNFSLRFTVVNRTLSDIQSLLVPNVPPGVTLPSQIIQLPAPLPPGASALVELKVTFAGAAPSEVCLDLVAHSVDCADCCTVRNCFQIRPACTLVTQQQFAPGTNLSANYGFTLENRSGVPVQSLVFDATGRCLQFGTPVVQLSPPLAPGETRRFTNSVSATPGCGNTNGNYCFNLTLYDSNFLACCTLEICLPLDGAQADIFVTKTAGGSFVGVSNTLTYTLIAGNNGPSNAIDVTLTDVLPLGAAYVSASGSPIVTTDRAIWHLGDLAPGMQVTQQLSLRIITPGANTNAATITLPGYDPNLSNNTATVVVNGVNTVADLQVTKVPNRTNVLVGDIVRFDITVRNNGPEDATNIFVPDVLDACLSFASAGYDPPTDFDFANKRFIIPRLASGTSVTMYVDALVITNGLCTNSVSVESLSVIDPNLSNNSDRVVITAAVPQADLLVTKVPTRSSVPVGDVVRFNITVFNNGPDRATNIIVPDVLGASLSFASAGYDPPVNFDFANKRFLIPSLASGTGVTMYVDALVTTNGFCTNSISVSATGSIDPNPANNTSEAVITGVLISTDLEVTQVPSRSIVRVGTVVRYDITVRNNGPDAATNIVVPNVLDSQQSFVTAGFNPPVDFDFANKRFLIPTLASGDSVDMYIEATATASGLSTNTVSVHASGSIDFNPANDTSTAVITGVLIESDLSLQKTSSLTNAVTGMLVTFNVMLSNSGPDIATNIVVRDVLPPGFVFESASPQYTMAVPGWVVPAVPSGGAIELSINARATAAGTFTNTAAILSSSAVDPVGSNDFSSVAVTVRAPAADLAVSTTASATNVVTNSVVTFNVTLVNDGPDTASNIVVRDVLPAGFTFVSASPEYTAAVPGWNVGILPPSVPANLSVTARATAPGVWNNTATVTSSSAPDPVASNNSSAITVIISEGTNVLRFTQVTRGPNSASIGFFSPAGSNYVIQYKNTLKDPYWLDLTASMPGTGGSNTFIDPGPLGPTRFYRLGSPASNAPQYTINALSGLDGSIVPTGSLTRVEGANVGFTATPDYAYTVDVWSVNGTPVLSNAPTFTLTNLQTNVNLSVSFRVSPVSNRFDNSTPLVMPDRTTNSSPLNVSGVTGHVSNVVVLLFITHPFDADLQIDLIGPDSTTVRLVSNRGTSGHNFGSSCSADNQRTIISDAAATPIASGVAPFIGTFRPESPLSAFAGKTGAAVNGQWRLRIADTQTGDSGTLNCWSLVLQMGP